MPFMDLIVMVVIVLTITVVMLSLFAIATRILANRREARIDREREIAIAALEPYLEGRSSLADTVPRMPASKDVALGALLTAADGISPEQYAAVHALAEHLGLHRRELEALRHRDWTRRAHAATRLGLLRYPGAAASLVDVLDDDMLDVRLAAAHSLAQLKATDALEPILRSLALPAGWPLQRCAEILFEMGTSVIEPLLALQRSGRLPEPATAVVIRVLGMLRARPSVPLLLQYVQHPDTEIRVSSAKALGQIADAAAAKALQAALGDREWPVRSAAAAALGQLRDRSVIPALAARLADPAWWVRFNAAESLYRLNGIAELQSAIATHADKFARDISRQVLEQYAAVSRTAPLRVAGASGP